MNKERDSLKKAVARFMADLELLLEAWEREQGD